MTGSGSPLSKNDAGGVRTLTLSRPQKLNAMNRELIEGLTDALADTEKDSSVHALILTGGDKVFSAGVDLKETSALTEETEIVEHAARVANLFLAIPRMTKPIFAAVEGYALGGGCGLALACDLLVASESAVFGYPEIKRGVMPALVTPNLVKRAGARKAFEFLATGKHYTASEMLDYGLVNNIVPTGQALDEARNLAIGIIAENPHILMWIKELIKESETLSLEDGLKSARAMNARARLSLKSGN